MNLAFPSTTIASLTGAAILATLPSHQAVASINLAYDNAKAETKENECLLENVLKDGHADIGVLGCGYGKVCVEDNTSSAGGRCIKLKYATDFAESRRQLATGCQYLNGTYGSKCVGLDACYGVDETKIGCGSCIGKYACDSMSGDVTIEELSCIGYAACYAASGSDDPITIAGGSCRDNVACAFLKSKHYGP